MNEAAAQRLHVALAALSIGIVFVLLLLLLPPTSDDHGDRFARSTAAHDKAVAARNAVLPWLGVGLAVGAGVGGLGTLVLWRRQSKRLEEGR